MSQSTPIPPSVMSKLSQVYNDDPYSLARILYFLASQSQNPRFIQVLEATINNDAAFRHTADNILSDMNLAENNEQFANVVADIWQHSLVSSSSSQPSADGRGFNLGLILANREQLTSITAFNMTRIIGAMSPAQQAQLMEVAFQVSRALLGPGSAMTIVNRSSQTTVAMTRFNKLVPYIVIGIQLAYDVYKNIRLWWSGKISGKRCAKNVIDCGVGIAGGAAGGYGGAALGSVLGTVGMIIGGIVGGIAGSGLANALADRLTQTIFDLPKSVALENAYRYLGLPQTASNDDINKRFRTQALTHHPDKEGGSDEKFQLLQSHVGVIKAARESTS